MENGQITGSRLTVVQAENDYRNNLDEVIRKACRNNDQERKLKAKMLAMLKRLADGQQLRSPDSWNTEGDLPNGDKYYAVKPHLKVRVYGWFSKGKFVISHYAFKKQMKLSTEDHSRVVENWRRIEEK